MSRNANSHISCIQNIKLPGHQNNLNKPGNPCRLKIQNQNVKCLFIIFLFLTGELGVWIFIKMKTSYQCSVGNKVYIGWNSQLLISVVLFRVLSTDLFTTCNHMFLWHCHGKVSSIYNRYLEPTMFFTQKCIKLEIKKSVLITGITFGKTEIQYKLSNSTSANDCCMYINIALSQKQSQYDF